LEQQAVFEWHSVAETDKVQQEAGIGTRKKQQLKG